MPLTSDINKKDMTEEDIKNRFVTPALNRAGWENDRKNDLQFSSCAICTPRRPTRCGH